MIIIRLQRVGKKHQPHFRVVLIEHTRKVKGEYNELLGSYNPRTKELALKKDRIAYWLSKGVKASATVHNLLVKEGVTAGPKVRAWRPKKSDKKEEKTGEQAASKLVEAPKEKQEEVKA